MNEPCRHAESSNNADGDRPRLFAEGFFDISRSIDKPQHKDEEHEEPKAIQHQTRKKRGLREQAYFCYLRWWGRVKPDRRIELILAVAIVVFAYAQWHTATTNNDSTARQADQLIAAAKYSAYAADRNANAAASFADSAQKINHGISDAVTELRAQADTTEIARQTSDANARSALDTSIASSHLDERPWIVGDGFAMSSEPQEGQMPTVKITMRNTGKTPALDLIPHSQASIWDHCASLDESKILPPKSIGVLAPGQTGMSFKADSLPYIEKSVNEYNAGLSRYCVRAKIHYTDVNGTEHWTTLCIYHTHGRPLAEFDYCSEGNDLDRNK
jgi:hypothetical protein